jgi:hypothetical protein
MKRIILLAVLCIIVSCKKEQHDLTVKGSVEGLQKGYLYLKKAQDTTIITIDSLAITGDSNFELHSSLEEPEVFYLALDKNSNKEESISFFADKGITEINTTLKNFAVDAKIKGSKQQAILEEYLAMISKFNNKSLDLYKANFDAYKANDTSLTNQISTERDNLIRKKYLYTTNFALTNKDSEVAPYIALTEIYDANIKLLDTINSALMPNIKTSKYGLELQKFIDRIKAEEAQE